MQGDLATSTEALLPQTLLLPITNDQDYRRWHMGNWHGTTGNPFPPYCRLDSQYPAYQCIYDMQQSGDTDAADRDHLFLSSWSGDDYVAGDGKEGFGVSPLSTQITPGQFATINNATDTTYIHKSFSPLIGCYKVTAIDSTNNERNRNRNG